MSLIDISNKEEVKTIEKVELKEKVSCFSVFNGEKNEIAVGTEEGKVVILRDMQKVEEIEHYENTIVSSVSFSSEGKYLAVGDNKNRIKVWDMKENKVSIG